MSSGTRIIVAVALAVGVMSIAAGTAASGSSIATASAKTCNIQGQQTELGASYVTSLKVRNTSCSTGKDVVRAFNRCRKNNGGANGRCPHRVLHYRCSEDRQGVPHVQYNSSTFCKRGERRVIFTYTQNV